MNLADVIAAAQRVGFPRTDVVRSVVRPAMALTPRQGNRDQPEPVRLGGLPPLPAEVPWPTNDGRSMSFIAQIELAPLSDFGRDAHLPPEGRLLFFYDVDKGTWGFDPKDAGSFAVLYVPDPTRARERGQHPKDVPEHGRFAGRELEGNEVVTLPATDSVLFEDLKLDAAQVETYWDLLEELSGDDSPARGLLGGHPDQIQGDMALECALVAEGLYCGDGSSHQDPRFPEIRPRAREWRLLLQVPTVEEADMMWGDCGCLYYWVRSEDLRARRFDRSWMILQCS